MDNKELIAADQCSRCTELLTFDALYLSNGERLCNECEDRANLTSGSIVRRLLEWGVSAQASSMAGTATLCRQAAKVIAAQDACIAEAERDKIHAEEQFKVDSEIQAGLRARIAELEAKVQSLEDTTNTTVNVAN
jgi:hypothetical protein